MPNPLKAINDHLWERREARQQRRHRANRARRHVRTTNGRRRSSNQIVINIGGRRSKRRRRFKIHSKKHGVLASVWLLITSLMTITWLTFGGVMWCLATLASGLATGALAIATFDPDSAVPDKPRPRAKPASPRATGNTKRSGSSSGTRAPTTKKRKPVCSARCQTSSKPVNTCECVCGGKSHGIRKLGVVR